MYYSLALLWAVLAGLNRLNWALVPCEWDTGSPTPIPKKDVKHD